MRRIIFLDIDGVLNHDEWYNETKGKEGHIDPHCVELLNQLEGAEIVISSSWGNHEGETEKLLQEKGLKLPVVGVTKKWHFKYEWICRGNEIEAWLFDTFGKSSRFRGKWGNENYEYVILDDDSDMLLEQADRFIQVDDTIGLTQEIIDLARYKLNLPYKTTHSWVFWVDDERDPKKYLSAEEYNDTLWMKNYDQFKNILGGPAGFPKKVYFDHDLGGGKKAKNGLDCAKLLVEYCMEHNLDLPEYASQSNNPAGKANIISYLDSYKKSRGI